MINKTKKQKIMENEIAKSSKKKEKEQLVPNFENVYTIDCGCPGTCGGTCAGIGEPVEEAVCEADICCDDSDSQVRMDISFVEVNLDYPLSEGNKNLNVVNYMKEHSGSKLYQMIANADLEFEVNNKKYHIANGTHGGFVCKNHENVINTWMDSDSFIPSVGAIHGCYITNTVLITASDYDCFLNNSYLNNIFNQNIIYLKVDNSIITEGDLKGDCRIYSSRIENRCYLNNSELENCALTDCKVEDSSIIGICEKGANILYGRIRDYRDILVLNKVGSSERILTAYRTRKGGVYVTVGCFVGSLDELELSNRKSHLGYTENKQGFLVKGDEIINEEDKWAYNEYKLLGAYIRNHFKLDYNLRDIEV